jgi:hypothetical protein
MTNILDAYGEDGDFAYMNGNIGGGVSIQTTASQNYRTGYARCAVMFQYTAFGVRLWPCGGLTTAWCSARVTVNPFLDYQPGANFWGLFDASNVLRIVMPVAASPAAGPFSIYKVNSTGTQTFLGMTSSGFSQQPIIPDKLDCNFDYSTTGFLRLYINGSMVFNYTGDITTDGQTEIGGTMHGGFGTRDFSLVTCAPTGPGTTDQWTGMYTNVNNVTVDDANFDTTTTSGDVQLYTMSGITTGNFDILTLVTNIRATQGAGSLSHIALAQEIGGTQYVTAPNTFPSSYGPTQFIQEVNPATGVEWTQSDVNSAGFQSGYKATT